MCRDFEYQGGEDLRRGPSAVLFNSRQSKFPRGSDVWIGQTCRAVDFLVERGIILYTSLGMHTWELAAARCSYAGGRQIIVLPNSPHDLVETIEQLVREFSLNPETVGFLVPALESKGKGKQTWVGRDRVIAEEVQTIYPIAVNSRGNLSLSMKKHEKKVDSRFAVEYVKRSRKRPSYGELMIRDEFLSGDYIVHFTRSRPGPWPDESSLNYYRAVWDSADDYCRSAGATLNHIVKTDKLRAGCDKIRGGFTVVSFSDMELLNAEALFRYRSRLVNPGFEPYGIAIRKEAALRHGIRAVHYGPPELYDHLSAEERPYYQNSGAFDNQWMGEHEWRHVGDVELSKFDKNDIRIVVPTQKEVSAFAATAPFHVESIRQ